MQAPAAINQPLLKVLRYIDEHLEDELSPRGLADVAGYSPFHFQRVFRKEMGETVMDYIRGKRMESAARQLVTSEASVWEIAYANGYTAHEAFTRAFKASHEEPPVAYRLANLPQRMLCAGHQPMAGMFRRRWEEALYWATAVASLVFPPELYPKYEVNAMSQPTMSVIDREVDELEKQIEEAKKKLSEARRRRDKEEVQDYAFTDWDGNEVRLSELFGDKDDLLMIHNMGTGCSYCTMWADGFNGLRQHLADRAALVVTSPDSIEVQKRFAEKRGWGFKMISAGSNSFLKDMGMATDEGPWPGASTFRRENGKIYRVARSYFGPGDDFCPTWPLLDMLQDGANGWEPKYFYDK